MGNRHTVWQRVSAVRCTGSTVGGVLVCGGGPEQARAKVSRNITHRTLAARPTHLHTQPELHTPTFYYMSEGAL